MSEMPKQQHAKRKERQTRSARPSRTAATTTAQAPVPQARVAPTVNQTINFILHIHSK